jgi:hypothetical protein
MVVWDVPPVGLGISGPTHFPEGGGGVGVVALPLRGSSSSSKLHASGLLDFEAKGTSVGGGQEYITWLLGRVRVPVATLKLTVTTCWWDG